MVIRGVLNKTIDTLKNAGIENAVFEANLIIKTIFELSPIDVVLSYNKTAPDALAKKAAEYAERRASGEPLQYILGVWEFMGLEFLVSPNVLIPRSDTETLAEAVLSRKGGMNLLDICSGSGCIALSIAHYNKNTYALGLDISPDAVELSKKNAEKLGLDNRVRFERADIMSDIPHGVFDVIVSNPPYIRRDVIGTLQAEVRLHEPHLALDGGEDGLDFYRRIIDIAPRLLNENGELFLEIGFDQADDVTALMQASFSDISVIKDLCGNNRVARGRKIL